MSKKFIPLLLLIFLISSVGALISFAANGGIEKHKISIKDEKTISLDSITDLNIFAAVADVNIIPVDSTELRVDYYGDIYCLMCNPTNQLKVSKVNNQINISVHSFSIGMTMYSNVKLDIYLPKSYVNNLKIDTVSSTINLSDVTYKKLDLETVSGSINLSSVTYESGQLNTVSGNIYASNVTGATNAETVSGRIDVESSNGSFNGETVSGGINVTITDTSVNVKLKSISGNLVLDLNNDVRFNLDTDTTSGRVQNQLGEEPSSSNYVNMETVSGDITIK